MNKIYFKKIAIFLMVFLSVSLFISANTVLVKAAASDTNSGEVVIIGDEDVPLAGNAVETIEDTTDETIDETTIPDSETPTSGAQRLNRQIMIRNVVLTVTVATMVIIMIFTITSALIRRRNYNK